MQLSLNTINERATKKEVQAYARHLANELASQRSATDVYTQLAKLSEFCTSAMNTLKEKVVDEREQFGKELIRANAIQVDVMESGVRYDFSDCNDPEWNELSERLQYYTKLLKERESFLKVLDKPLERYNEETGELFRTFPPKRKSTTTPKLTW